MEIESLKKRIKTALNSPARCPVKGCDVVFPNDPDSAALRIVVAQKEIALDDAVVSMTQRQLPFAVFKCIEAIDIAAGLAGNDLDLAVASVEVVALHDCP